MHLEDKPQYWYRGHFLLTTDQAYLDATLIQRIYESDLLYWAHSLKLEQVRKMLRNSLVLAIYSVPHSANLCTDKKPMPNSDLKFIGLARVITDEVTFCYLTDVFVLEEYQGQGLATWMMQCLKEILDKWPDLRRLVLLATDHVSVRLYEKVLCVERVDVTTPAEHILEMPGRARVIK